MEKVVPPHPGGRLEKALSYMEAALEVLDEAGAPADIGAHLDLAISRLREVVGSTEREISRGSKDGGAYGE